jgi:hypothetical protein
MTIKRYDWSGWNDEHEEDAAGDWVKFADYESVVADLGKMIEELRLKLQEATEEIELLEKQLRNRSDD